MQIPSFVPKKDIVMRFMLRLFLDLSLSRFAEIYNERVYDLLNHRNERLNIVNYGDNVIVKGLSERRVGGSALGESRSTV